MMSFTPPPFRSSFALLDTETRLLDWDAGFSREWEEVAHMIRAGSSFRDIAREIARSSAVDRLVEADLAQGDPDEFLRRRADAVGTERSFDYRTLTGRIIHVDETRTAGGGLLRLARDVTEERGATRALDEARAQIEAAGPSATGAYIEFCRNTDGSYVFPPVSDSLRLLLGLPREFVGRDATELHLRMATLPGDDQRRATALEESARTLQICTLEFSVRDGADQMRRLRQSVIPRRDADGTVVFAGTIRDVTREQEAEYQIELLRSIVVRSSDSIVAFETTGPSAEETRILYVNPKFMELFGFGPDVVISKPARVLRPDSFSRTSVELIKTALRRGDGIPVELQAPDASGRMIWIEARVETVQRFDDGRYRWAIISRDITDRRRAQEELLRAKEEAEAGNRSKSQFLATMSHELRTPLNAIIGFAELLERGVGDNGWIPAYNDYLHHIAVGGRHLLGVINSVLDLSKIEAGSLVLEMEPIDIEELIRASIAVVSGMARQSGVVLLVEPMMRPFTVAGDFMKLKQVLLNILSNAIKFTQAGGKVTISTSGDGESVALAIADTGRGIAPDDLARITQPFVQVENALSRQYQGTGLGLSIATKLCSLHGGRLDIASVQGAGTTVRITLPATQDR